MTICCILAVPFNIKVMNVISVELYNCYSKLAMSIQNMDEVEIASAQQGWGGWEDDRWCPDPLDGQHLTNISREGRARDNSHNNGLADSSGLLTYRLPKPSYWPHVPGSSGHMESILLAGGPAPILSTSILISPISPYNDPQAVDSVVCLPDAYTVAS